MSDKLGESAANQSLMMFTILEHRAILAVHIHVLMAANGAEHEQDSLDIGLI